MRMKAADLGFLFCMQFLDGKEIDMIKFEYPKLEYNYPELNNDADH